MICCTKGSDGLCVLNIEGDGCWRNFARMIIGIAGMSGVVMVLDVVGVVHDACQ